VPAALAAVAINASAALATVLFNTELIACPFYPTRPDWKMNGKEAWTRPAPCLFSP
jgi:hypothetical protein